jgi:purine-binding chemotaxis protein CheW
MVLPATLPGIDQEQDSTSYLLFRLSDELYATQVGQVREIARWREPLAVPGAPPALPGIINQRGVILPIVDTRLLLGLETSPPDRSTRFVLINSNEVDMALLVDSVVDIVQIATERLEAVPSTLDPQHGRLLQAVMRIDDRPVSLLDPGAIITALTPGA